MMEFESFNAPIISTKATPSAMFHNELPLDHLAALDHSCRPTFAATIVTSAF
jgi:hypothetical protein